MKGSGKLTCVSGAIGALKETLKELSESAMSSMHFRQGNLSAQRGAFYPPKATRRLALTEIWGWLRGVGSLRGRTDCPDAAKQLRRHEYVHVHLHLHHRHLRPS